MRTPGVRFTEDEVGQRQAIAAWQETLDRDFVHSKLGLHDYVANRIASLCWDNSRPLPANWRGYRCCLVAKIAKLLDEEIMSEIRRMDIENWTALARATPPSVERPGKTQPGPAGGGDSMGEIET
jgi:hypothetical protein